MPNKGPPLFVSDLKRTAPPPKGVASFKGGGGGWGGRGLIMVGDLDPRYDKRRGGGGGGGLIMVRGLVPRYHSGGGGRCTLQAQ